MLLDSFIEGVFLSGFFTVGSARRVLRRGFRTESATVRLRCVSSVFAVRLRRVHAARTSRFMPPGEETFIHCLNDSLYNLARLVLRNITRQ